MKQIAAMLVILAAVCSPCLLLADPPPEALGMRIYREPHTIGGGYDAAIPEKQGAMDFKDPKTGKVTRYILKDGKWVPENSQHGQAASSSSSPAPGDVGEKGESGR